MDIYAFSLLHIVLTLLYFLGNIKRKPRLHVVTETVIVFAIPVFGLLLMLGYRLSCYLLNLTKDRQPEIEKEQEAFFRGTHLGEDIIPLNDAFLVDDVQKKRHYFTDAIKQAVVDNERILQMAMHQRAVEGVEKIIRDREGNEIDRERVYSDSLLAKMVDTHTPEYKEAKQKETNKGNTINVQIIKDFHNYKSTRDN